VADICSSTGCHAVDDPLLLSPVRELCHDLLDSAATISVLVQAAGTEAGAAVAPESQLPDQLRRITAAASKITAICAQVLDQCAPPAAHVFMPLCDPSTTTLPQAPRHEGGLSR
jgi:hypothetical protein